MDRSVINRILVLFTFFITVKSWNLSNIGIANYTLTHVSIFNNRAYLSIKPDEIFPNTNPTLIEASWPESVKNPRVFPSTDFFYNENCKYLQNVISTDVDTFGRLWILDEGNFKSKCPGKVIVYNLLTNRVVRRFTLNSSKHVPVKILVDTFSLPLGQKAYIGLKNFNILYVCDIRTSKCNLFYLEQPRNDIILGNNSMSAEDIAIDRKNGWLYITSTQSLKMYRVDLTKRWRVKVNMEYMGDKLGHSQGLIISPYYGMCYHMTRDIAIVCWNMNLPIRAEEHIVLEQSIRLLKVQQLFADLTGDIWAVINDENKSVGPTKFKKKNEIGNDQQKCIRITNILYNFVKNM